jgi:hypothetical protein
MLISINSGETPKENPMLGNQIGAVVVKYMALVFMLSAAWPAIAQDAAATAYPTMAPLEQYLIADPNAEVALARSAAPESISRDAEVMVLGRHGYETAVKGTNGFVCLVERAWTSPIDDPGFWNPKGRAPICFNAAAARTYVPRSLKKTELILAGRSKAQMVEAMTAAIEKKELPPIEAGAMCYMLSKQGYLGDPVGHWHPHLMFFFPHTDPSTWGVGMEGSPIFAFDDKWEGMTVFLVPVRQWSDGTADH